MPAVPHDISEDEKCFLENIGFRIQYLRKKKDLSQMQLAELSYLSNLTIAHIESTRIYGLSLIALHRIAKALCVDPRELLDLD